MSFVSPEYFFDLATYQHARLFIRGAFVWEAIQHLEEYLNSLPLGQIEAEIPPGVTLVNPETIFIGKGSTVEPGAYIKGPCWLGEGSSIRHGAYIRGNVLAGNRCVIGHDTEVKNTIFLDGAQAAHFAYLGDSILGNLVNLGAGTKCANLRLDHANIVLKVEGHSYPTQMRKLGAIIGDRSQLGCNSVTNPGTLLGQEVFSYPCTSFAGFAPSKTVICPETSVRLKKRQN